MFKASVLPPILHVLPDSPDFAQSPFIRNSKKAKSISLINQNRKQAFIHQSHLRKAFKKKYIHSFTEQRRERVVGNSKEKEPKVNGELELGSCFENTCKSKKMKESEKTRKVANFREGVVVQRERVERAEEKKSFHLKKQLHMYPKVKKLKTVSMEEMLHSFEGDGELEEEPFRQYPKKLEREEVAVMKKTKKGETVLEGWEHRVRGEETEYLFRK